MLKIKMEFHIHSMKSSSYNDLCLHHYPITFKIWMTEFSALWNKAESSLLKSYLLKSSWLDYEVLWGAYQFSSYNKLKCKPYTGGNM